MRFALSTVPALLVSVVASYGRNVGVKYRYADGNFERQPALAAEPEVIQ